MPTLETRDLDTFVTFGARKRFALLNVRLLK